MSMERRDLTKILHDEELKKILEEKGFEEMGATTTLYSNKEKSERYTTLNALVGFLLDTKKENRIIVELSEIGDSGTYFIKFYSKK